jgi:hypothetical protein
LENDSSKNADKIEDGTISIQKQILKQHDFREKKSNDGRVRERESSITVKQQPEDRCSSQIGFSKHTH